MRYLIVCVSALWVCHIIPGKFANPALVYNDLFVKQCMLRVCVEESAQLSEHQIDDLKKNIVRQLNYLNEVWEELFAVREEEVLERLRNRLNDSIKELEESRRRRLSQAGLWSAPEMNYVSVFDLSEDELTQPSEFDSSDASGDEEVSEGALSQPLDWEEELMEEALFPD